MTLQECYRRLNGNYEDARHRLMNDRLIEKFMLKFPNDPSMSQLQNALTAGDYELAFRCAHTLKGVAGNLSFSALQASASALTEQLRSSKAAPDPNAVRRLQADYSLLIDVLQQYQAEM